MDRGIRIGCGGGNVSTNIKHIAQSTCIRHTFTLWSTFIAEVLALSNNCSYTLPSYDPKAEFNTVSLMSKASTNAIVSGRNCTCLVKPKKKKTKRRKEEGKKIHRKENEPKKKQVQGQFLSFESEISMNFLSPWSKWNKQKEDGVWQGEKQERFSPPTINASTAYSNASTSTAFNKPPQLGPLPTNPCQKIETPEQWNRKIYIQCFRWVQVPTLIQTCWQLDRYSKCSQQYNQHHRNSMDKS